MNVQPHKPPDPPTPSPCQQDILSGCILGSLILRRERSMPRDVCVHVCVDRVSPHKFKVKCTIAPCTYKTFADTMHVFIYLCASSWVSVYSMCVGYGRLKHTHGPNPGALREGWLIFNPHKHIYTPPPPLLHLAIFLRACSRGRRWRSGGADILEKSPGQEWGGGSFLSKMALLKPENYK